MKKLIALTGLFMLSFGAQADNCRTEMIDYAGYVRLIITQAQPNYYDPYCQSGYQQCLASIRLNPAMRPSCRVMRLVPQGNYYPNPQPNYPQPRPPRPQWNPGDDGRTNPNQPPRPGTSSGRIERPAGSRVPAPAPVPTQPTRPTWNEGEALRRPTQPRIEIDTATLFSNTVLTADGKETVVEIFDGQRAVGIGETVYMFGASYTVVAVKGNEYDITPEGSRNKKDIVRVEREKIAIARGCSLNICVTDPVFNISRGRMEAVAGITTAGELITKNEVDGKLNQASVKLKEIALGKGCVMNSKKQDVCVGSTVQANNNRYFEVVAVQHDQKLVLKEDTRNGSAFPNISAADLIVIR